MIWIQKDIPQSLQPESLPDIIADRFENLLDDFIEMAEVEKAKEPIFTGRFDDDYS